MDAWDTDFGGFQGCLQKQVSVLPKSKVIADKRASPPYPAAACRELRHFYSDKSKQGLNEDMQRMGKLVSLRLRAIRVGGKRIACPADAAQQHKQLPLPVSK